MGKGRDKRKKREDPAKAATRAAKQAQKLARGLKEGDQKGEAAGFNNEEAIELSLKRIQKAQLKLKTTQEVENVPPPTPRANVVFVAHPLRANELIIFGGEFWNGDITEAFNDMYFYHVKKKTWARLSTAINPAPRSSSQAVVYKQYVILFGGEFVSQTQSQYLHFRDVWRYDSRTSEWQELKIKGSPSSRSGHRMVLWKRNAVMFGGFYDNAQECHYYNDLWVLSQLEGSGKWTEIKTSTLGEQPAPRSGHSMSLYNDTVFVYGGYSTEKFNRFKKSEATVHHDLWMLKLPQGIDGSGTAAAAENAPLPTWTKVRLAGVPPPIRCAVSSAFKDKKMYLFGGVVDIESPGGKLESTFSNDLFVFHMDTLRFYPVVLRKTAAKTKTSGSKLLSQQDELAAHLASLGVNQDESGENSSGDSEDESSEEDEEPGVQNTHDMRESFETRRNGQIYPHRRMDASLVIVGHQLFIYGGQFESGKKEITMSDLFALNLSRLDTYEVLLSQDLSAAVWMGKETESNAGSWESGSTVVSAAFDMDYDEDDEDEEDDEGGGSFHGMGRGPGGVDFGQMPKQVHLDPADDGEVAPDAIPAELDMEVTPSMGEMAPIIDALTRGRGKKGLQVHKQQLLAQLGAGAAVPTPAHEESLHQFFDRTSAFWISTAEESYEEKTSDKKLRREALAFAKRRYTEAKELLEQLKLVEEREKEEAKFFRERRLQKEKEWDQYEEEQRQLEKQASEALKSGGHHDDEDEEDEDDDESDSEGDAK